MTQRNIAIDITKAIAIILMILGHCQGINPLFRNFIFSFHMPLFFILSGYFYKQRPLKCLFISGYSHLVKPYFITSFFVILLCFTAGKYELTIQKIVGMIMSNGGTSKELIGSNLPFIGPIWFLLALFWCKFFMHI